MAKRRRTSLAEDIMALATMLPWWLGIILAAVAYAILHHYAMIGAPTIAVPGQIHKMVVGHLTPMFAQFGQYVVPPLLLVGALTSFRQRRRCVALVGAVAGYRSGDALRNISWRDFELLVGEAFCMRGFSVTETGGGGADGGIDLELWKDGEIFLVQCKQWRALQVSVNIVREQLGVMAARGASGGFVVTSGTFTAAATDFVRGQNIELVDGKALAAMIEKARVARPATAPLREPSSLESPRPSRSAGDPSCPCCGGKMVKRIARKGANASNAFWGCTAFPQCRGLRRVN